MNETNNEIDFESLISGIFMGICISVIVYISIGGYKIWPTKEENNARIAQEQIKINTSNLRSCFNNSDTFKQFVSCDNIEGLTY